MDERQNMKDSIIITDIGSTTTKALLLTRIDNTYRFVDYTTAHTTVEKPHEDVQIGIYNSIKKLEDRHNLQILSPTATQNQLEFNPDFSYLTTSSAGGGLQILVVGLTKVDSAASAERAAFGVGGVLIDTLAVDDNRTVIEQINIINNGHPDILLFCGGIDGGALSSVYRLAEIVKLANPVQKFSSDTRIPLVYAGNVDAIDFIQTVFSKKFDLHIVPNLRPTMREENLTPTKDKIHELFMESVMEQAPGYARVKRVVDSDIIPTPSGVMSTLKLLGKKHSTILAVDIGGATTDVFSNLQGSFFRTVSANYGMSYSIGNVWASSDFENDIKPYLIYYFTDLTATKKQFQNYIGNKILYPDSIPQNDTEKFYEHIIAIMAIRLSKQQHFKMHFSIKRIGFLDVVKNLVHRDKWKETMYYPHYDSSFVFRISDINVVVVAGGVISNASHEQAILIISEGIKPEGITEIWRDRHFISPHIGVLSQVDEIIAEDILHKDCIERLAIYVRPVGLKPEKSKKLLFSIEVGGKTENIHTDDWYIYTPETDESLQLPGSLFGLAEEINLTLYAGVPLIMDTTFDSSKLHIFSRLNVYDISQPTITSEHRTLDTTTRTEKPTVAHEIKLRFSLPHAGKIYVNQGDEVTPTTLLAENKFDPPKIFVVLLSKLQHKPLTPDIIKQGITIKIGDTVNSQGLLWSAKNISGKYDNVYSPVRGVVESIDIESGTIVMREIQDYPLKPVDIDVAGPLKIKPKDIKGYIKRRTGDFISAGDVLAVKMSQPYSQVVSPYTGTIQQIDTKTGSVVICYDKKPFQLFAQIVSTVDNISDHGEIMVRVNAISIDARIGFGVDRSGLLEIYSPTMSPTENSVIYTPHVNDTNQLRAFAEAGISGLIVNSIPYHVLTEFLGSDIGVALTGNEDLPFSVVILDGFYESQIVDDTEYFSQHSQKNVLLKPFTQIRAGATRPGILISR
jgi:uncharacterized protein (TIGR01319 family)